MRTKPFLFIFIAALIVLSGCMSAGNAHFVKAVYDGEPRTENGHVDIEETIHFIKLHNANTYNYLIVHSEHDWDDFHSFLPRACSERIDVWVTIVPPYQHMSEPFKDDYEKWAEEIAKLSLEYKCLKAWSIDNVMLLKGNEADKYIADVIEKSKNINPGLEFIPVVYIYDLQNPDFDRYKKYFDGIQFYYKSFPNAEGFGGYQEAAGQIEYAKSRFSGKIILGIYATPWQKEYPTTAHYIEKLIDIGKEKADGVMIYTLQREGDKLDAIREGFK